MENNIETFGRKYIVMRKTVVLDGKEYEMVPICDGKGFTLRETNYNHSHNKTALPINNRTLYTWNPELSHDDNIKMAEKHNECEHEPSPAEKKDNPFQRAHAPCFEESQNMSDLNEMLTQVPKDFAEWCLVLKTVYSCWK